MIGASARHHVLLLCFLYSLYLSDCIGSAFNIKGAMQCPNCRKIEKGQWLYANGGRSYPEFSMDEWTHDEDLYDVSYSEMVIVTASGLIIVSAILFLYYSICMCLHWLILQWALNLILQTQSVAICEFDLRMTSISLTCLLY